MEDTISVKTLSPAEAAKILHIKAETIRAGLRAERFDFGTAIPPTKEKKRWNYIIIESKFLEYVNIQQKTLKGR